MSIITASDVEAALRTWTVPVVCSGLARASRFRYAAGIGPGLPIPILRRALRPPRSAGRSRTCFGPFVTDPPRLASVWYGGRLVPRQGHDIFRGCLLVLLRGCNSGTPGRSARMVDMTRFERAIGAAETDTANQLHALVCLVRLDTFQMLSSPVPPFAYRNNVSRSASFNACTQDGNSVNGGG